MNTDNQEQGQQPIQPVDPEQPPVEPQGQPLEPVNPALEPIQPVEPQQPPVIGIAVGILGYPPGAKFKTLGILCCISIVFLPLGIAMIKGKKNIVIINRFNWLFMFIIPWFIALAFALSPDPDWTEAQPMHQQVQAYPQQQYPQANPQQPQPQQQQATPPNVAKL